MSHPSILSFQIQGTWCFCKTDDDHDSDDSMASDASSGPSHRGNSWQEKRKVDKDDDGKKAKEPKEKNGNARRKQEKEEESVFTAKGANEYSDKVRKNSWFGKRK
ncbi:uncharacterized protein LOC130796430 isoform X2 [Actinidia eriantha]|uniref:uncharacterized protein LOC130796430 isoform X2 n=1 Tax=Actinidia eriantha TaxID=165200 RepID=UPI002585E337|nr:uncharacterized protein LOC130796430 isoform X2 [Actinidia eriantha]